MEFAINGFKDAKDFLKKFNRNLFFNQDFNSKAEIIQFLCDKASDEYQIDSTLYESIIEHEATVSRVNEEKLFYLKSKGLSENVAKELFILGFIDEFKKELPMEYAVELNRLLTEK